MSEIIQYLSILFHLFHSIIPSRPSILLQMTRFHSFFMANIPLCVCIYTTSPLSIHLLISTEVASNILAIVNNAAMNIGVHMSFLISVFVFFR